MRTITSLLLTATLAALASCSKKSASYPINLPGNTTAYVAGAVGDSAVYFVNGKEYALTSGATPASANSIAVAGSDIYVAGYESNGKHIAAKYWKNGHVTVLADTSMNSAATAIAVVGADVYVAGWVSNGLTKVAVVWRNGGLTGLTPNGHGGAANALLVDNGDIYIAGYDSVAGKVTACYWENGAINSLPDSLPYAVARGIAISGSDVYVVGWDLSADDYSYLGPRLWKNGSVQPLATSNNNNAIATSINVVNGTTYIGGMDNFESVYWQNGSEKGIADGYQLNAITVDNGIVYGAGYSKGSAIFWRNGIGFSLDNNPGYANSIVVTN